MKKVVCVILVLAMSFLFCGFSLFDKEQNYIDSCTPVTYNDLKNNPNSYVGKKIVINAQVSPRELSAWYMASPLTYIEPSKSAKKELLDLEDEDYLLIYGTFEGTKQYTWSSGDTFNYIYIKAEYAYKGLTSNLISSYNLPYTLAQHS